MSENAYEKEFVANLVVSLCPRYVLELGTGDGATAASIMEVLPQGSYFTTINWPNPPSGDNPLRYLGKWADDKRLWMISGDTRECAHRFADRSIDLLFIDSTHTCECATEEWTLYRPKMRQLSTVVVDDLNHNDMMAFWNDLPYDKQLFRNDTLGVFTYDPQ